MPPCCYSFLAYTKFCYCKHIRCSWPALRDHLCKHTVLKRTRCGPYNPSSLTECQTSTAMKRELLDQRQTPSVWQVRWKFATGQGERKGNSHRCTGAVHQWPEHSIQNCTFSSANGKPFRFDRNLSSLHCEPDAAALTAADKYVHGLLWFVQ